MPLIIILLLHINFSIVLDCGAPVPLAVTRVKIEQFNDTRLDSMITFSCEGNNITTTAVCASIGEWVPNPASHNCGNMSLGNILIIILFCTPL